MDLQVNKRLKIAFHVVMQLYSGTSNDGSVKFQS